MTDIFEYLPYDYGKRWIDNLCSALAEAYLEWESGCKSGFYALDGSLY